MCDFIIDSKLLEDNDHGIDYNCFVFVVSECSSDPGLLLELSFF